MPTFTPLCHKEYYSGDIQQIALKSLKCKRGQLELPQEAKIEALTEISLKILPFHLQYILSLLLRMLSSGILCHVAPVRTDASEEHTSSV
jgi:hypothetical protein